MGRHDPNLLADLRRKPLAGAALGLVGLLLAMLAIYVGTGLHDGFGDWDLHRLGRRLRRALIWALLAVLGGLLLHAYYERLLQGGASGWVLCGSVLRAFAHFPLFGALALFAMIWSFVLAGWWLLRRLWRRREPAPDGLNASLQRWIGPPVCGNAQIAGTRARSVVHVIDDSAGVRESFTQPHGGNPMNSIIYIVGLIVVVMVVLSLLGLR